MTPPAVQPTSATSLIPAYGYSEQTAACQSGSASTSDHVTAGKLRHDADDRPAAIYHTLGAPNAPTDNAWDYLAVQRPRLHQRDRADDGARLPARACSPSSSPRCRRRSSRRPVLRPLAYGMPAATWPRRPARRPPPRRAGLRPRTRPRRATRPAPTSPWPMGRRPPRRARRQRRAAPVPVPQRRVLLHRGQRADADGSTSADADGRTTTPTPPHAAVPAVPLARQRHNYVGGPGGAGWHKMLDFFEVPSPAFKAIGEVATGVNYDWARQDLRPGLLNLNLIIDEEVFLGLMGSSIYRSSSTRARSACPAARASPTATHPERRHPDRRRPARSTTSYHMPNVGVLRRHRVHRPDRRATAYPSQRPRTRTTQRRDEGGFADFLSLRHGGSGFLFGYGNGGRRLRSLARSPPSGRSTRCRTPTSTSPSSARPPCRRRPTRRPSRPASRTRSLAPPTATIARPRHAAAGAATAVRLGPGRQEPVPVRHATIGTADTTRPAAADPAPPALPGRRRLRLARRPLGTGIRHAATGHARASRATPRSPATRRQHPDAAHDGLTTSTRRRRPPTTADLTHRLPRPDRRRQRYDTTRQSPSTASTTTSAASPTTPDGHPALARDGPDSTSPTTRTSAPSGSRRSRT